VSGRSLPASRFSLFSDERASLRGEALPVFAKDGRFVRFLAAAFYLSQKLPQRLPDDL